jgi:hypothetical protein
MSLSDDIKAALVADGTLNTLLTGGIFNDVEEISRQNTASAFDATTKEIKPCALIKHSTEVPTGPYLTSARTTFVIYFYQRAGYDVIELAMGYAYADLNEKRIGTRVWNIEYVGAVYQQRDLGLDCPLGSLRFMAVRQL